MRLTVNKVCGDLRHDLQLEYSYFAQQSGGGHVHAGVICKIYREAFFKKEKNTSRK